MIVELAPAKINLALHVRARRPDGYHDIETLFAFCADGDEIRLAVAEVPQFEIAGPFASVLSREGDNLVTRAERGFAEAFGIDQPHAILLLKRLPVASGIGGGSADAAATLRALAQLHDVALDDARLFAVADGLGSDVPACLLGRTAIGKGRGEDLAPMEGTAGIPALLVNPGVAVSTAEVFARWDGRDRGALGEGRPIVLAMRGRNDLELPARAIAPEIDDVLAALEKAGRAWLVRMSGSGATCFALYDTADDRARAAKAIRGNGQGWWCLETVLS
jgi:4-diphosphocytidyl-2-C-methyl-D-erythritol kinase